MKYHAALNPTTKPKPAAESRRALFVYLFICLFVAKGSLCI